MKTSTFHPLFLTLAVLSRTTKAFVHQSPVGLHVQPAHDGQDPSLAHFAAAELVMDESMALSVLSETPDIAITEKIQSISTKKRTRSVPPLSTWKLRLNTKEDSKWVHKVGGMGFVLSSAVILAAGAMNGFNDCPQWMAPVDTAFLISTGLQSYSSIQMVNKHRIKDPAKGSTFSQMAIQSFFLTFIASWMSPYCPDIFRDHPILVDAIFTGLVAQSALMDFQYVFSPDGGAVVEKQAIKDLNKETNGQWTMEGPMGWAAKFAIRYSMALYNLPNYPFLAMVLTNDQDRVLELLTSGFHDAPHMSMANLYYGSVFGSALIGYMSFVSTLSHKKLVSKEFEFNFVMIGLAAAGFLGAEALIG